MELPGPLAKPSLRYRPRHAAASPLYRLVSDHLEEYLLKPRLAADKRPVPHPVIERSLRSFLECGIHRFGVVRFQCKYFAPLSLIGFVVLLSFIGLFQRRFKLLWFALLCGWFGPLPGCVYIANGSIHWNDWLRDPVNTFRLCVDISLGLMFFGGIPFILYCFIVGLLGGWIILQSGREMMPWWAQPTAIIVGIIVSAIPWILLGFVGPAICSAIFWCILLLLLRNRIFKVPRGEG
mgnify:CR=1 FL=1